MAEAIVLFIEVNAQQAAATSKQVCLSLRLKGIFLYTVGFLFHVECCIRQL